MAITRTPKFNYETSCVGIAAEQRLYVWNFSLEANRRCSKGAPLPSAGRQGTPRNSSRPTSTRHHVPLTHHQGYPQGRPLTGWSERGPAPGAGLRSDVPAHAFQPSAYTGQPTARPQPPRSQHPWAPHRASGPGKWKGRTTGPPRKRSSHYRWLPASGALCKSKEKKGKAFLSNTLSPVVACKFLAKSDNFACD